MSEAERLRRLARALGLAPSHTEIGGRRRQVAPETLRAIVAALGYPADGREAGAELRIGAARRRAALAPALIPSFEPDPPRVALHHAGVEWRLEGEGRALSGRCAGNELELPPLVPGYYRLHSALGGRRARSLLIRAPAKAWRPPELERGRGYGFSVQLYELVGSGSVGIGDFGDLAGLVRAAGHMGATALGVNPLHALFLGAPERASPYSPSSRLALNPLYLDLRRLPGFDGRVRERCASPAFRARAAALNAQAVIDYPAAAREKMVLARMAFENFRAAGGDRAFERFGREARGPAVWALHEAIAAEFGYDRRAWPDNLLRPDSAAAARYAAAHRDVMDFHRWLQWQAEAQLAAAAREARDAGMGIGLYRDLALGADPGGAEIWAGRDDYLTGLAVGSPPDPFNPNGQNWGFPPLNPERLREGGLAPFVELVRSNMRHAGALRIDHVLGLNRLFVIPEGADSGEGAYLRYPLEALLAAVTLESHRARCLVVGEDLGTVPRGLRPRLARRGIFSLRLLYFEHDRAGRPRAPAAWPSQAVASPGTHDMAPLAGWWRNSDLALRDRLDLWPDARLCEREYESRRSDRRELERAFESAGGDVPAAAIYRRLACTPSRLVMISPEDALDVEAPVNLPGTTDEVPNWRRRRLPPWPEWLGDPRFGAVVRAVQVERGRGPRAAPPPPTATYRLQLNRDFGFLGAAARVPYLARLGVSHLYLSPVLEAAPGSPHGYDMVNPARLDDERGGTAGFEELLATARRQGLELIVDFVPNHMGAQAENPWWRDMLEFGRASRYADAFDVDWAAGRGRVVLPILGAPLDRALARGEVALSFAGDGGFSAVYRGHRLPLAPESIASLLAAAADGVGERPTEAMLRKFVRRSRALGDQGARRAAALMLKADLAALAEDEAVRSLLQAAADACAADPARLRRVLGRQHWRLAFWRDGLGEINYRRFFDVVSLAALRCERPAVFAAAHVRVREWIAEHRLAGLRLDHVDGLAAPTRYLAALNAVCAAHGGGVRLWVEKILGVDEALPPWPVSGTTGYDFLNDVTRLFMHGAGAERLRALWRRISGTRSFESTLAQSKRAAVRSLFAPTLGRVAASLAPYAPVPEPKLRAALIEAVAALPVYRAYPDAAPDERTRALLARMTSAASRGDAEAGAWLARCFTNEFGNGTDLPPAVREGLDRFWQLSASAMAKGLEDTAFYRDFSLLALNEVGGDPTVPSFSSAEFHRRMGVRARDWPAALGASATHDTKRGEDARLRLAMLSHHAEAWAALVAELRNAEECGARGVHPADQYLVWQTLAAIWPPAALKGLDDAGRESLDRRLREYLVKALREGKTRSSWLGPKPDYEQAVVDYASALLDAGGADFRRRFLPFVATLARDGALVSLAALTLKLTAPGVPDFYQGTELWDLSLVDPDNRRLVDYDLREQLLAELKPRIGGREPDREDWVGELLAQWPDGRIKLYVLASLLHLRGRHPDLFARGSYEPLPVAGARADDILAFRRRFKGQEIAVVVARSPPDAAPWGDTRCEFGAAHAWRELFTGRRRAGDEPELAGLLSPLPAAVLLFEG